MKIAINGFVNVDKALTITGESFNVDIAADMDLPLGVVHLGQIFSKVPSKDGVHRRKQLAVPGGVQPGLSFPDKLEGDFRMGERDALHHRRHRVALLDVLL